MVVVSDASPVSSLFVIGKLDLLHELFGSIILPSSVLSELSKLADFGYDISAIRQSKWIIVKSAEDIVRYLNYPYNLIREKVKPSYWQWN